MAAPVITISAYTKTRISAVTGYDESVVSFTADQAIVNWEARADGAGLGQGGLVGSATTVPQTWNTLEAAGFTWDSLQASGYAFETLDKQVMLAAGATDSFVVENEELTWGDKGYRINVYGQNKAGEWTGYAG